MKRLLIPGFILFIFFLNGCSDDSTSPTDSHSLVWEKTYGGTADEELHDLEPTPDGGYILGGGAVSGDGDVLSGNQGDKDFWVIKTLSTGVVLWEQSYGGTGFETLNSLKPTADGGYILGGRTLSNDGDIQSGLAGFADFWVVKTNDTGVIEWEQTYGGTDYENINSVEPATDDGYIFGGTSTSDNGDIQSGNNGQEDFWVVKTSDTGIIDWEQTYGGSGKEELYWLEATSDGGYLLGGSSTSADNDVQSGNQGEEDFWVVKISGTGNIEWEQTYGGSSSEILYSFTQTGDGGYLLCGGTESDDGDIQSENAGNHDFWAVKINSTGTLEWEQTYGGSGSDEIHSIQHASALDGGYILGGYTYSDDGDVQSGNNGSRDYWVVKINGTGDIEWERTYGGSDWDDIYSIQVNPEGEFLLGGHTFSNDLDVKSVNNGEDDFWLVKTR